MDKEKGAHPQSQSLDHKTLTSPPTTATIDDSSVVEERDENKYEVDIQKEKVNNLMLSLDNEKRNVEKIRLDVGSLLEEKIEKERRVEELEIEKDLYVKKLVKSEKVIDELKEKIDLLVKETNAIEIVNNNRGKKILDIVIIFLIII
ncbi:unnamed protein product [Vicia faba]|uniref:Uncharacterized protein n=1 Tax=Vicia faba TaxID=3906 RepID=A0AAV1A9A4_VICFA|nr:unnamed protein product [Vicia faba]